MKTLWDQRIGMHEEEFMGFMEMAEGAEGLLESDLGSRTPAFLVECLARDIEAFIGTDGYVHMEEA